jgi:hypothetical protein
MCSPTVLRKLKALTRFDGCPVAASEKALFADNAGALTLATMLQHGTAGHRFGITGTLQLCVGCLCFPATCLREVASFPPSAAIHCCSV